MRTVSLLGSTGLVGRELRALLLDDPTVARVVTVVRHPSGTKHPKLDEHVVDFRELDRHARLFAVDQIFCALGTTIKVAGSQQQFRFVDHELPIRAAKLGLADGATHYLLVSALGANPKSRIFYNRVKGEVERDLTTLGYRSVTIARPSLLLGARSEFRLGERIASKFGWLMPPSSKPIPARAVAHALAAAARDDKPGTHILSSGDMRKGIDR